MLLQYLAIRGNMKISFFQSTQVVLEKRPLNGCSSSSSSSSYFTNVCDVGTVGVVSAADAQCIHSEGQPHVPGRTGKGLAADRAATVGRRTDKCH